MSGVPAMRVDSRGVCRSNDVFGGVETGTARDKVRGVLQDFLHATGTVYKAVEEIRVGRKVHDGDAASRGAIGAQRCQYPVLHVDSATDMDASRQRSMQAPASHCGGIRQIGVKHESAHEFDAR